MRRFLPEKTGKYHIKSANGHKRGTLRFRVGPMSPKGGRGNLVTDRILNEIKGRMLEDIVLLETTLADPKKEVFVLQFAVGEFDMVIFDSDSASCEIFGIKYSDQIAPQQTRHLLDAKKCADTEHRYGTITGKTVLYRGENRQVGEIRYWNAEDYLKSL